MANEQYDPKLSEAGLMELVLALQNHMKQPDTIKLMATKPPGQVSTIHTLQRAAIAYIDAVEGRCVAQEPVPYSGADELPAVFGRRWKLAVDGFGLQRDDANGNYVHIDDAISTLHQSLVAAT